MDLDFNFSLGFGSDQIGGLSEMNFADQVHEVMTPGGVKTSFDLLFGAESARDGSGKNIKIGGLDWMGFGAEFDGDGARDLDGAFSTQMSAMGKANGGGEIQSADQTMGKFKIGTEGSMAKWEHMGQDAGSFSGSKISAQLVRADHFEFDFD